MLADIFFRFLAFLGDLLFTCESISIQPNLQEGAAYRGAIRRHVDLDVVRGKLEAPSTGSRDDDDDGGGYYPAPEFFRDLLLLCTNVVVFFPCSAAEHAAAVEARALVSRQAAEVLRGPKQERFVAVTAPAPGPAPAGGDIVGPLIEKVKPLIVCRKRSSIAKAAALKKESTEKGEAEKEEESEDGKEAVAAVARDKSWGMRTKKRGGAVRRLAGTRLTDDSATGDGARKGGKKGGANADAAAGGPAKKRNAVDFLKRLNQGSSPTRKRGSPLGTTRRRLASGATEEQPKTRKRGTGRKEGTGRGGGTKRGGRGGGGTRRGGRGGGRSLKRGGGPATPPPAKRAKTNSSDKPATGKRGGRRSVG